MTTCGASIKPPPNAGIIRRFSTAAYYEDVLVVRVEDVLSPKKYGKNGTIRLTPLKHMLADEGTTILKFFLAHQPWIFYLQSTYRKIVETTGSMIEQVCCQNQFIRPVTAQGFELKVGLFVLIDTLKDLKMQYPENKEDLVKHRNWINE